MVSKFDDPDHEPDVRRILEHHGVRVCSVDELPPLEAEIVRDAR